MSKFFGTLALACVLAAGAAVFNVSAAPSQDPHAVSKCVAIVYPTSGSRVTGRLEFHAAHGGVRVTGEIRGLPANSKHGFHIHEFGDMSKRDGTAMGGHFNPTAAPHGLPNQERSHVGDMGNIQSDARGLAIVDITMPGLSFSGASSILGRGVVVHEKPDDGGQPTGNAGGRIGYGVIGVALP